MQQAGSQLKKLHQEYKNASSSKRQDLDGAVNQLVKDLNKTLKTAQPLVRHLTENLELGTVQDLVDLLTPGLATLVSGVEGLLIDLAPGLATIGGCSSHFSFRLSLSQQRPDPLSPLPFLQLTLFWSSSKD